MADLVLTRPIGRSRGGLTTKTDTLVDGRDLALVMALTRVRGVTQPHCEDCSPGFGFRGLGPGQPHTRPDAL